MLTASDPGNGAGRSASFEVVIAGGGVAGLEAAFALRGLAPGLVNVTVVAPQAEFVYRPNSVKEPFTRGYAQHFALAPLIAEAGAELVAQELADVDAERQVVHTVEGRELAYDALLLAPGAILHQPYEHVTTVDDAEIDEHLHGLVQDVEEGYVRRLAFVIPAPPPWLLPAYELALLTAQRAWEMQAKVAVTILTPERAPLDAFGERASDEVAQLLAQRQIELITSAYCEIPRAQTIVVSPSGRELEFDRIVALPQLRGPAVTGVPQDGGGFMPIDRFCRVRGAKRIYAAGDATDFPIKHGGLAAQEADTAAHSIAALAGAPVRSLPLDPVLEGVLVTGDRPLTLSSAAASDAGEDAAALDPTPKIVAKYLADHLETVS